uniref:ATP synthase subunit f, mitochondrial n=1 Tax=Cacopsylla melanoneura TaxID=428564 RepID=A0A8D8ZIM4_9HEMI
MGFGDYPVEYNPRVHGPYDPARFYGKADTPLGQVKINELASWFGRRSYSPKAMTSACSRAFWRWNHKYILPQKCGPAGTLQLLFGACLFSYVINYPRISTHRRARYH